MQIHYVKQKHLKAFWVLLICSFVTWKPIHWRELACNTFTHRKLIGFTFVL